MFIFIPRATGVSKKCILRMVVDFFGDAAVIVISTPLLSAEFICVCVLTVCVNDIEGHGVLREADCEESA